MQAAIKKGQARNKHYHDKSTVTPVIAIGTQVYVRNHRVEEPNKKVSQKLQEPYHVLKLLLVNKYEVMCERTMETSVQHWNDLKVTTREPWKSVNF